MEEKNSFLSCCHVEAGSVFSLVGAGGKTSLLFHLGKEVKELGESCLLTTSTRIHIPLGDQYDNIDLSGKFLCSDGLASPGIHVAGRPLPGGEKMTGLDHNLLATALNSYFLTVIEADGAAGKSLKGWKDTEPVVHSFTSHTIGVVDIQMLGKQLEIKNIHRPHLFFEITRSSEGEIFDFSHLENLIYHPHGIFGKSMGEKILFINRVESSEDCHKLMRIYERIGDIKTIGGSLKEEVFYA